MSFKPDTSPLEPDKKRKIDGPPETPPDAPDETDPFIRPVQGILPIFDIREEETQKIESNVLVGVQAAINSIDDYGMPSSQCEIMVLAYRAIGVYLAAVGEITQDTSDELNRAAEVHLEFLQCNDQDHLLDDTFYGDSTPDVQMDTGAKLGDAPMESTDAQALRAREDFPWTVTEYVREVGDNIEGAIKSMGRWGKWIWSALKLLGVSSLGSIGSFFTTNEALRTALDKMFQTMYDGNGNSVTGLTSETFLAYVGMGPYAGFLDKPRDLCVLIASQDTSKLGKFGSAFQEAMKNVHSALKEQRSPLETMFLPDPHKVAENWAKGKDSWFDWNFLRPLAEFLKAQIGISVGQLLIGVGSLAVMGMITHYGLSYRPERQREYMRKNSNVTRLGWQDELKDRVDSLKRDYRLAPAVVNEVDDKYNELINTFGQNWQNAVQAKTRLGPRVSNVNKSIRAFREFEQFIVDATLQSDPKPNRIGGPGGGPRNAVAGPHGGWMDDGVEYCGPPAARYPLPEDKPEDGYRWECYTRNGRKHDWIKKKIPAAAAAAADVVLPPLPEADGMDVRARMYNTKSSVDVIVDAFLARRMAAQQLK